MNIVILTGAGISAESGLTTFRDNNGLWEQYAVEDVASVDGWERNPSLMLDFYNMVRRNVEEATPNAAHYALAELEKDEKNNVTILTTNIDNLHEKAGSSNVIHLHGDISYCRDEWDNLYDYNRDITVEDGLRPHVVWFGEGVENYIEADEVAKNADIFIAVGSTLSVFPVAGLIYSSDEDVPRIYIDPGEPSNLLADPSLNAYHIRERATVGVPNFCKMLSNL